MLISTWVWRVELRDTHNRLVTKLEPHHLLILSPVTKCQRNLPEYLENRCTNDRLIVECAKAAEYFFRVSISKYNWSYDYLCKKIYNFPNFILLQTLWNKLIQIHFDFELMKGTKISPILSSKNNISPLCIVIRWNLLKIVLFIHYPPRIKAGIQLLQLNI